MWLSDFKAFLKRNQAPHSRLEIVMMGKEPFDMVTIIDEQKYERMRRNHKASWGSNVDDWIETGHGWNDFMRMCWVANLGFHDGEVPYLGSDGIEADDRDWVERPYRGIRRTIEILLKEGCLRPTREVAFMGDYLSPLGYIQRERLLSDCAPMARSYGDL